MTHAEPIGADRSEKKTNPIGNSQIIYIYGGDWRDDIRHGHGTLTYPDGRKFVGEWPNGKKHGQGVRLCPSEGRAKKIGVWERGVFREVVLGVN